MTDLARSVTRSRWWVPLVSFVLGIVMFAALWIGDEHGLAWFALALMSGTGVLFLLGGRFDMVRGLRGDGRDEYWARIDLRATALTGSVLIALVSGMCLWEWGHGRDGTPYTQLAAVAGVSYIAALAVLRWRS